MADRDRQRVRSALNPDPEHKLRTIQARFRALGEAVDRRERWRRRWPALRRSLLWGAAVFLLAWAAFMVSPFPPLQTVRHVLAWPSCDAARTMDVAPASRGRPGYWAHHDADSDGMACEPPPPAPVSPAPGSGP